MRKLFHFTIFFFLFLFFTERIFPQRGDTLTKRVNYTRLAVSAGVTSVAFVYAYGIENTMWWKGRKSPFHFNWQQDWTYAMGSDKFGHFFFGSVISTVYSQVFEWCGFERDKSVLYGALFAFGYQTFLEVRDGFSSEYGFSWGDFLANVLGESLPYWKNKYPFLRDLKFKISLYPSERFRHGSNRHIIDDYESIYDWISYPLYKILPANFSRFIPRFINIAIGHSVKKLDLPNARHHEFYIGLDWNLEELSGDCWLLKVVKKDLNFYRLPAPAVKIYPTTIWYGIKF